MNKAIFFDRDGVINFERGTYTYKLEHFSFVRDIFPSLKILHEAGYLLIIITNQGGIAKKLFSKKEVDKINQHITDELKKENIEIADIYYCPHHSDIEACICRKPDSLMVEKAVSKYNIDTKNSYFIGDKKTDIQAGEKLGIKGILVKENQSILDIAEKLAKK